MTQDPPPWPWPDHPPADPAEAGTPPAQPSPPDNPAPHNPAPHNQAPHTPAPHNQAPHNPAPDNRAPGYPAAGGSAAGTDGFAVTSVVLGALGGGLVAIGFGWAALRRIRRSGRPGRGLAVTGIVLSLAWLAVGAAVAGVVIRGSRSAVGATSGSSPSRAVGGRVAMTKLRVGDCVRDDLGSGEVTVADVVPCPQAHHAEVFSLTRATGIGAYPGDSAVRSQAEDLCTKAVPANLVSDLPDGAELLYSYPRSPGWLTGDRVITCLVNLPGFTTTVELVNAGAS